MKQSPIRALFFVLLVASTNALAVPRGSSTAGTAGAISLSQKASNSRLFSSVAAVADEPRGGDSGEGTATIPNEVFNLVKVNITQFVILLACMHSNACHHHPVEQRFVIPTIIFLTIQSRCFT